VQNSTLGVQLRHVAHKFHGGTHPSCCLLVLKPHSFLSVPLALGSCAAMPPRLFFKCFFPQYNLMYITRPVFIVNSIVDYAAIFILNDASGTASRGGSREVLLRGHH